MMEIMLSLIWNLFFIKCGTKYAVTWQGDRASLEWARKYAKMERFEAKLKLHYSLDSFHKCYPNLILIHKQRLSNPKGQDINAQPPSREKTKIPKFQRKWNFQKGRSSLLQSPPAIPSSFWGFQEVNQSICKGQSTLHHPSPILPLLVRTWISNSPNSWYQCLLNTHSCYYDYLWIFWRITCKEQGQGCKSPLLGFGEK